MSLPESMSRIVIVGSKSRLDEVTTALFEMGVFHLIDHTVDADEGFSIGSPRPYSAKASERLLALRSAEKDLGIRVKKVKDPPIAVNEVEKDIESGRVETIHADVIAAIDGRNEIDQRITELKALKDNLEKLSKLPIDLGFYRGYESLVVFVGSIKSDPSKALDAIEDIMYEVSFDKTEGVVAVFAKKDIKDKVSLALTENGYAEIPVPDIEGSPAEMLAKTDKDIEDSQAQLEAANAKIAELSEEYKSFIAASDEELSLKVQEGELPLRIATSEYSFVIDAWVPTKKLESAQKELEERMGGNIYMEVQETRGRSMHETEAQEERFQQTPTKCNNGKLGKRFEYAVSLVSIPKYQEIDPATLVSLFFPFFFGFMVGDLGYAIPFIVLGAYGMMKAKSKDFQSIGTVLFFGGIWAAIFGFFFFGEMLGMHFIGPETNTTVTWESLLGVKLPDWFQGLMIEASAGEYGVSKLHEVTMLLKLSVYMGCVHLFIAYVVGFMNGVRMHGFKEGYLEKGGWLFSFLGMVVFCYGLTEVLFCPDGISASMTTTTITILIVGAAILVLGVASCFPKEGAQAILELPGIVGNVLSYTRLAAIGMSKAGMALAFNYITFIMMWQTIGGIGGIIAGCVVFLIGHLMIWVLAILSAGLHGLRLQYVESMNKFFTGGGVLFAPLAIKRKHTKNFENIETEA